VIAFLGLFLRSTTIVRRVPPYALDGIAAVMITAYRLYFLRLAYLGSA
jgi:hypothetical protein